MCRIEKKANKLSVETEATERLYNGVLKQGEKIMKDPRPAIPSRPAGRVWKVGNKDSKIIISLVGKETSPPCATY